MYRVVLIDDEPWTIIDLKETMHWQQFSMEVIADFENPKDALQYIRHNLPEIIFVDIKMPTMSGLDLILKVKEFHPNCICIIVSGYAEFELAQKAISVGAFEYCLKPFNQEKGNLVLQKIKSQLDKDNPNLSENSSNDLIDNSDNNVHLNRILKYIELNLHKKITLQDVAEHCFITKSYCSRLLSKYTNCTFSQYLLEKRMEFALRLLKDGKMNMTEIAQWVGFSDYFYFSKSFKKYFGKSPKYFLNPNQDYDKEDS